MTSPVIDAGDDLPLTIPALLRRHVERNGAKPLVVCDEQRLTYAEAEARSRRVARGLLAAGVSKGSHVGVLYPNGPDFVVAELAAARIGAVVLPLSTLSTPDELRWLLANADIGFLLSATEFRTHDYPEKLRAALPEVDFSKPPPQPLRATSAPWLRRIWFSGPPAAGRDPGWSIAALEAQGESVDDAFLQAIENRVSPADRFVIIHTSGSTSTPKGVIHQQGSMIRYLDNVRQVRSYTPDTVLFSFSPWFWTAGFCFALNCTLVTGMRLVTSNAAAASEVLDLFERERPNACNGWPASADRLGADPSFARRDLSFLRGGNYYAIMPPDVKPRDAELRHNIFGCTEVGSILTMSPSEADQPERLRGSYGPLLPGFEAKIVDPDSGRDCGTGELGELWIRGTFVMEGYYGKHRSQVFEPDGWWRAGDLGHLDAEGNFHFKGRHGDMIKTSGANVAPREVEPVLREAARRDCLVVGVPDPQRGQIVVGVVLAERDDDVDEPALQHALAAKLSSYKVPRRIIRLAPSEVPMMSSGKLDARKFKALVAQRVR